VPNDSQPPLTSEYLEALLRWRRRKEQDLLQRDSWVALDGLHWLHEGRQTAGSDPGSDLRLPASAPPRLGEFELVGGRVYFHPNGSAALDAEPPTGALEPDTTKSPTFLRRGDLTLVAIERGGRFAVRVWDNARLTSPEFGGRRWYAPDGKYILEAEFEPGEPAERLLVPDVTGEVTETPLLGEARFLLEGEPASLRAIATDDGLPWFLFADPTNETTTYPSGRFLVADPPRRGAIVLDFNRAYNPPCAFTAYATCPLPPAGNRLSQAIQAGETYSHGE
jgi:uncharacterized protein (DUF1684 family)